MRKVNILFIYGFIGITIGIIAITFSALKPKFNYQPPATKVATAFKATKPITKFNLVDTNGNPFTDKSLRGHWTLLFFGYPKCPDICPSTLNVLRESWSIFATNNISAPVRFIFVDISSQPTEISLLRQFVQNYNQTFIGLSGERAQMQLLADQLGIYSNTVENKIDHSAALMLIDPLARLHAVFTPPFSANDIVHDLRILAL